VKRSGSDDGFDCALEARKDVYARLQPATGIVTTWFQRFHLSGYHRCAPSARAVV